MPDDTHSSECPPLIEASTLRLYQNNIFRITGLPVDATPREVSRRAQELQMMEEMGTVGGGVFAFPLIPPPTTEDIRQALARMKEPEHRMVDEFFWYWPEKFGDSKNDEAIQALLAGDAQKAIDIWVERESYGNSIVATHNLAVMFHMFAVDWTNHHVNHGLEEEREEKVRDHWLNAFERWEDLADSDVMWDVIKDRVRSLNDEVLTTGFVRRMRLALPQAFDRVNAEAALKFAERGEMNWAETHVDLMRQTHQGLDDVESTSELVLAPTKKRLQQLLRSSEDAIDKDLSKFPQVATSLMEKARPLMELFDLFYGSESEERSELFDEVAQTVYSSGATFRKETEDHSALLPVLKAALHFAAASRIREKIIEAIQIVSGDVASEKLAPLFEKLKQIEESSSSPKTKLGSIKAQILPLLPKVATEEGFSSEVYGYLSDSVAHVLREISIRAHNEHFDFDTAFAAIQLAQKFARESELKQRLDGDLKALNKNKQNHKCTFCKQRTPDPSSTLKLTAEQMRQTGMLASMTPDLIRQITEDGGVTLPRCSVCAAQHEGGNKDNNVGCIVAVVIIIILIIAANS
ncbi:MAG: hypothetical protein H7A55_22730 [Verrucomicrobiaceae bacterium]|nr:hypothetical protein [Verrucomicrobiaceae bacterium]